MALGIGKNKDKEKGAKDAANPGKKEKKARLSRAEKKAQREAEKKGQKGEGSEKGKKGPKADKGKKSKYPTKTTINLLYKERETGRMVFLALSVFVFAILLYGITRFLVTDQMEKVESARTVYMSMQAELAALQKNNAQFSEVEAQYSHYGDTFFRADELSMQDRVDMLAVINSRISLAQGMQSINIDGNTATVKLISITLREVAKIVDALEESNIVSYVGVDQAAVQNTSARRSEDLDEDVVVTTLTIVFKPKTEAVLMETEGGWELLDQLAARKEAAEHTGEEDYQGP